MIQSRRGATLGVVAILACELAAAAVWRWPITAAPIQSAFEYGTGHVTVVSEHWRRAGAWREHFLPVMSIDSELPEWPYRGPAGQAYTSVPPLAFILHYAATRALPGLEPVLLGKLLAQGLVAASVVAAAIFLVQFFDIGAVVAGLSFAIWGVPFLVWFANGYFAVNVGLAAQFVLVAWCGGVVWRCLSGNPESGTVHAPLQGAIGAGLAFAGAFADYMPLVGNAVAAVALVAVGIARGSARKLAFAAALGLAAGSAAAVAATAGLYGTRLGLESYLAAVALRTAQRTGHATPAAHFDVIVRQMLTAWPVAVVVALGGMLAAVLVCSLAMVARRSSGAPAAVVVLVMLAVAAGPSLFFHYAAVNYVALHWWFAGTWITTWTTTVSAFVMMCRRGPLRLFALAAVLALVAADAKFASTPAGRDPVRADSVDVYRGLGADLPHDDAPLVVTDVTVGRQFLFEDFPYTTAYLRRPVLLRELDGTVRLPMAIDPYDGHPIRLGGEDKAELLRQRGGDVYVAYDPDARRCFGAAVPLGAWRTAMPIAVCRVPARTLVDAPASALGPLEPGYACNAPPPPPTEIAVSSRGGTVVISWNRSSDHRVSSVLEAGRASGLSDALTIDLGQQTRYSATGVRPGTYYVRLRAKNACGAGAPSPEVIVEVE